jgi:hypothetical protein
MEKVRFSDQLISSFQKDQSPYGSAIILTLYTITGVFLSNVKDKFNIGEYYGYVKLKIVTCITILGTATAQRFKVLCYKSKGRWFDPSWCHWIFH